MEFILMLNKKINEVVWGPPMLILLVGTGVVLCFASVFIIYRKFPFVLKNTFGKIFTKSESTEGSVTPFQAVSTALAATVGTGNIVGVTLAITTGGPGAVFWMWLAAIVGMTTKFAEVTLSVATREKNEKGEYVGGPMYYIKNGMNMPWLAMLFAIFGSMACFGIGAMTQSNSVASAANNAFGIEMWQMGVLNAVLAAVVIIGGIKRIGAVAEKIVPFMAAFYILGGVVILSIHAERILPALQLIFSNAFTGTAATGGFLGSTVMMAMRYGVARGVFTNEAGLGSAPIAHAAAHTDHPVRQGLWGSFEVFVDTILVCTITALVVITSGLWSSGDYKGLALTSAAFQETLPIGGYIVSIGLILFAFTTIISWSYYGEKCIEYVAGSKAVLPFRMLYVVAVFVGAIGGLTEIWDIADTLNGLMAIPNLIALLALTRPFIRLVKDFFADPDRIRDPNEDYMRFFKKQS